MPRILPTLGTNGLTLFEIPSCGHRAANNGRGPGWSRVRASLARKSAAALSRRLPSLPICSELWSALRRYCGRFTENERDNGKTWSEPVLKLQSLPAEGSRIRYVHHPKSGSAIYEVRMVLGEPQADGAVSWRTGAPVVADKNSVARRSATWSSRGWTSFPAQPSQTNQWPRRRLRIPGGNQHRPPRAERPGPMAASVLATGDRTPAAGWSVVSADQLLGSSRRGATCHTHVATCRGMIRGLTALARRSCS
ncbi:MAG: hypothetical protein BMS9Abin04_366 [Planctomycetia bacterium]|nr:MAG: hypothetical protein BMS9Abin04_366 [Planctomycetia bacterium]